MHLALRAYEKLLEKLIFNAILWRAMDIIQRYSWL